MAVADAFVAAVKASVASWTAVRVYDGLVTGEPPAQYVAVYVAQEIADDEAMCRSDFATFRCQVTSVVTGGGTLGQEVRGLAGRVRDHLLGRVLVDPAWKCAPIVHDFSNPPLRDEQSPSIPTLYATDGYLIRAARIT